MKIKFLFPIFLIFIAVIAAGCVSAADNTTAINNQTTDGPQVSPNDGANQTLNATVILEAPKEVANSPLNNTTEGPKLDIKGPIITDSPIIHGPKVDGKLGPDSMWLYNHYFKNLLKSTNQELTHDVVCKLLLRIYKDNDAAKTKEIAYKILKNNNFSLSTNDVNNYFNAISGNLNDEQSCRLFNRDKSSFDEYVIQKRLIDSDKIQVSDAVLEKYSKDYDGRILELILKVYNDYSESMTVKIVTKIVNIDQVKDVQKYGGSYSINYVYSTDMVKTILNKMIDGKYGNYYYIEMKKIQLAKIANTIIGLPLNIL